MVIFEELLSPRRGHSYPWSGALWSRYDPISPGSPTSTLWTSLAPLAWSDLCLSACLSGPGPWLAPGVWAAMKGSCGYGYASFVRLGRTKLVTYSNLNHSTTSSNEKMDWLSHNTPAEFWLCGAESNQEQNLK